MELSLLVLIGYLSGIDTLLLFTLADKMPLSLRFPIGLLYSVCMFVCFFLLLAPDKLIIVTQPYSVHWGSVILLILVAIGCSCVFTLFGADDD